MKTSYEMMTVNMPPGSNALTIQHKGLKWPKFNFSLLNSKDGFLSEEIRLICGSPSIGIHVMSIDYSSPKQHVTRGSDAVICSAAD